MKNQRRLMWAAVVAGVLLFSGTGAMAQGCDHGGNHTIQVAPDGEGGLTLRYRGGSGDSIRVCVGDTVTWVLTGSDRTFFVDFLSGAPFPGNSRRPNNTRLSVTIDADTGEYDYDVGFDGDPGMDPKIIVER